MLAPQPTNATVGITKKTIMSSLEAVTVLIAVVKNGGMPFKQIMKKYNTRRTVSTKIAEQARVYLNFKKKKTAYFTAKTSGIAKLEWLREHLAGYPFQHIADAFAENWRKDITEKSALNRKQSAINRQLRAHEAWASSLECFDGTESMNTLLCVLFSAVSVYNLTRDVCLQGNSFAHFLVLKCTGVYLVLMTDADPRKRFPLDAIMRVGDYTSTYLWLNLKAEKDPETGKKFTCWESRSSSPGFAARNATRLAAVVPTKPVKEKQFTKVNEATTSGMHILAVLWMMATDSAAGQKAMYKYVQPHQALTTSGSGIGDSGGEFTAPWALEIKEWAGQWGPTVPPAPPPPPPPRVQDVYVGPFYDETENPGSYEVIHLLMKEKNGVVITNDGIGKTSEVENRYSRTFTATHDDGIIAFEKVVSYCSRGIPLCCINKDTNPIAWGLHPEQKPNGLISRGGVGSAQWLSGAQYLDLPQGCRVRLQVAEGAHQIRLLRDRGGVWCGTHFFVDTKGSG